MREKLQLQCIFLGMVVNFLGVLSSGCNRTCGSRTVKYPFGFSVECPYRLDTHCSPSGEVYLKGYKVTDITNETVIIDPWSHHENSSNLVCFQELGILSVFTSQFALTSRNVFLLGPNCTQSDCSFNISNVLEMGDRRENCSKALDRRRFACITVVGSQWLPWKMLEESTCRDMLSSTMYEGQQNGSISFKVNNVDLAWWLNGTCRCSANAICSEFLNPNSNETVHRCSCAAGFSGDGFLEGSRCIKDVDSACSASGYLSGNCGKNSKLIVAISSITAAAIVVSVILFVYRKRGASSVEKKRRLSVKRMLSGEGKVTVPIYSYRELEKATKGFSDKERLGSGAFGTVYAGKLPSQRFVAVKKIRHIDSDGNGMERVLNEVNVISSVDHPHLLRLLGCCLEERKEPILVFEFMPNGTLCQHLQRERGEGLPWRRRIKIAADTAGALAYLHSAINPPIYHRDIKSSNILLDYDFNCKVADFGLSRLVLSESSHISTRPQGTPGYLDPQYHQNFHLSDKSDVYSFGVVLAEMITGLKVVDFSRRKNEINLASLAVNRIGAGTVDEIVDPFLKADKEISVRKSVHRVVEIAFRCLAFDKDARPSMTEVARDLSSIADDYDGDDEEDDELKIAEIPTSAATSDQDHWFSSQSSASSNFN
ncbi:hypothetical protein KI387_002973, partial [Taxus chinensis]